MPNERRIVLGSAIRDRRKQLDLTQSQVCELLGQLGHTYSKQHLSQVERGDAWPSSELTVLLENALDAKGVFRQLLRTAKVPRRSSSTESTISIAAHLFFPLFVNNAPLLNDSPPSRTFSLLPCSGAVRDKFRTLYQFPFGVLLLHETHVLNVEHLGEVAMWRTAQINRSRSAAISYAHSFDSTIISADCEPYCFTTFVVLDHPWSEHKRQQRAVQLLALPSVLLATNEAPEEYAEALICKTVDLSGLVNFSTPEGHDAYASWSAVAIAEFPKGWSIIDQIVDLEIQIQALWCYSNNVEALGKAFPQFDIAFLRRAMRKLQQPRSTEHVSIRHMREAIVSTSRIIGTINGAVSALTSTET
jgi:transcriptional regulator with XRE-family HTH domain